MLVFILLALIFLNQCSYCKIEFSPLVEIGVNKRHYYPEETTDEGPTRVDAETGTFLKTYQ